MLVHACGSRCAREVTSSEADPARGRQGPSSEAHLVRGEREPWSEADLVRGGREPSSEADLLEGVPCWAALVGHWGHRGVGRAMCVCFALGLRCVCILCFLQVLSRIPPGYLGEPQGCPRQ
jgi:hypothetical protein